MSSMISNTTRMKQESSLLRKHSGNSHNKVTFIELFFDLIFVFCGHSALPLFDGAFHSSGCRGDTSADAGDLVGLDLHIVGDELVGPGKAARTVSVAGHHACGLGDVLIASHGLRRSGYRLCGGICSHPGWPHRVFSLGRKRKSRNGAQFSANPGLAYGERGFLDRWSSRLWLGKAWLLDLGARIGICFAFFGILGSRSWAVDHE